MPIVNSYALVAYLRGPLADFVDNLRWGLTPGCTHRAHITLLPPRPLPAGVDAAIAHCENVLRSVEPFDVRIGAVSLFETSEVIKLSLDSGEQELRDLHDKLNRGPLRHDEKFCYEPHITLAQDVPKPRLQDCLRKARQAWKQFGPGSTFTLNAFTFVQEVESDCWSDLATVSLGGCNGAHAAPVNGAGRNVARLASDNQTPTARR